MKFLSCFSKKNNQIDVENKPSSSPKIELDQKKAILDNLEYIKLKINSNPNPTRQK